jgi:hypothetical protein
VRSLQWRRIDSGPTTEIEGLSGAQLQAIAGFWKKERREIRARFGGWSMEPTLPSGSELLLRCGDRHRERAGGHQHA